MSFVKIIAINKLQDEKEKEKNTEKASTEEKKQITEGETEVATKTDEISTTVVNGEESKDGDKPSEEELRKREEQSGDFILLLFLSWCMQTRPYDTRSKQATLCYSFCFSANL